LFGKETPHAAYRPARRNPRNRRRLRLSPRDRQAHARTRRSPAAKPGSLTPGERELIATYVSSRNDCYFCQTSHGAAAAAHLGDRADLVDAVKRDYLNAEVSDKLKALLRIAGLVQQGGKSVTAEAVEAARAQGATDLEIHDTVLIAAAFCMYNRYVDGLATWQPQNPEMYAAMGEHLARNGYLQPMEAAATR
jgi:uncharacterized peroxidase-related enzyme